MREWRRSRGEGIDVHPHRLDRVLGLCRRFGSHECDGLTDEEIDIELAGDVRMLRSHFIDGIKSIPIQYTPESA